MSLPAHMAVHLVLLEALPVALLVAAGRARLTTAPLRPVAAGVAGIAIVITWHIPALFDAALAHPILHQAEHASLVVAGLLLWAPMLSPTVSAAGALAFLFVTRNAQMVLGNVFLWAPSPLYRDSGSLHDQRLAGAIMLGEGLIVGMATGAWLFRRLLREEREAAPHRDTAGGLQQLASAHPHQRV
jgi:cytochrome c oxidase assembly factor CtaG